MGKKILSVLLTFCLLVSLLTSFGSLALAAGRITVGSSGDYSSIAEALTHVENGGTIELLEDINESVSASVSASDTVITIDGGGYTVTAPDQTDSDSIVFAFAGSGTMILKNITLQGGTATGSHYSIGLKTISGSVNILSGGNVSAIGGQSEYMSQGLQCNGTGVVDVDVATGGTANTSTDQTGSVGVYNSGTGTVNVYSATGGASTQGSIGVVNNSTGTVNVTYAAAGNGDVYGDGIDNMGGGCVNAYEATEASGTMTPSYAVYNGSGTVNANTASTTNGTVNTNVTALTLNKGSGVSCVLDSITIAASGDTTVGTLPSVTINGQYSGKWYTDSSLATLLSGTAVAGGTSDLYSSFYQLYSISGTIANSTGNGLAATLQLLDSFGNDVVGAVTANSDGTYDIPDVPAGTGYTIEVAFPGYIAGVIPAFDLTGSVTGQDLTLAACAAQLTSNGAVTNYDTIQNALDAAADGDTVTVLRNSTETLTYPGTVEKTFTVDGGGYTVTAPDSADSSSFALVLGGSGTIILQNITLQGGTVSSGEYTSSGLSIASGSSLTVLSGGAFSANGGGSSYRSAGVIHLGAGAVNVDSAAGGSGTTSYGVYNGGSGTVNVNTAQAGTGSSGSYGIYNNGGTVNAAAATGDTYGVYNFASSYVNVTSAQGNTYDIYNNGTVNVVNADNIGTTPASTVNYGSGVTPLTLNKGAGAACVLGSLPIAAAGDTTVGTLPGVMKDGQIGTWYTTGDKTMEFTASIVSSTTAALYSTFYTASDTTPPAVSGVTPSGAGASTSGNVVITFNEAMGAAAGTVSLTSAGGTAPLDPAGGSWSADAKTYTIAYSGLSGSTAYTVNISGFRDAANNSMSADISHSFTTWVSFAVTTADGTYAFDSSGNLTISSSGTYHVEGPGTTVAHRIKISDGIMANITLSNVNIDVSSVGGCAFQLQGTAAVDLTLEGTNTLKSAPDCASLQVPENATLSITGGISDALTAIGPTNSAGIGGGYGGSCGAVTISGGTVTASSTNAAAIGGGFSASGGVVTISGGTVTANASTGAGIGGGREGGNGATVTISGGTLVANSDYGAGIGGGFNQNTGGAGGIVTISGGTITATGQRGAGIGGGGGWYGSGGNGNTVTISGGTVRATSGWGAGIGGGSSVAGAYGGSGGAVNISGGSVTAIGGDGSENIGKAVRGISSGTLQNNDTDQTPVHLTTVSLDGLSARSAVTSLTASLGGAAYIYGINDMTTDTDGKLYLFLPENVQTTNVRTAGSSYAGSVTTTTDSSTSLGTLTLDNPAVTSVKPDGTGAALSGNVVITFTKPMNTSAGSVSLDRGATILSGGSWSDGDTVYTAPYSGISYNTTYTVSISGFKDASGNIMADDTGHSFATVSAPYSGGGGGSSGNVDATTSTSGGTTTATVEVRTVTGKNGIASGNVTDSQIADAIRDAEDAAHQKGTRSALEISVDTGGDASGVSLTISQTSFHAVAGSSVGSLTITTALGSLTFNRRAIEAIDSSAQGAVVINVRKADTSGLSDSDKAKIGDRPVYDFTVTSGDTVISDFGGGTVTVSLPYTPAAGEDINSIVIYYISGSGELVAMPNCIYDAKTGTVTFTTTHFTVYAVAYNNISFADVSGGYEDSVNFVAARGIMNGTGNNLFEPDITMTRAMFVSVLCRLSGDRESYENPFTDVSSGVWYETPVAWAASNSISSGTGSGLFAPKRNITREQLAVMLYNYAIYMGYDLSIGGDTNALSYNDAAAVSAYAYSALQWACRTGIMSGDGDGNLNPQRSVTRAGATAMLQRFIENVTV